MPTAYHAIERCGIEIEIEIEFRVTSYGSPGGCPTSWGFDPPEAPEWEPERIETKHAGIVLDINRDFSDDEYAEIDVIVQEHIGDMAIDADHEDYMDYRDEARELYLDV